MYIRFKPNNENLYKIKKMLPDVRTVMLYKINLKAVLLFFYFL